MNKQENNISILPMPNNLQEWSDPGWRQKWINATGRFFKIEIPLLINK